MKALDEAGRATDGKAVNVNGATGDLYSSAVGGPSSAYTSAPRPSPVRLQVAIHYTDGTTSTGPAALATAVGARGDWPNPSADYSEAMPTEATAIPVPLRRFLTGEFTQEQLHQSGVKDKDSKVSVEDAAKACGLPAHFLASYQALHDTAADPRHRAAALAALRSVDQPSRWTSPVLSRFVHPLDLVEEHSMALYNRLSACWTRVEVGGARLLLELPSGSQAHAAQGTSQVWAEAILQGDGGEAGNTGLDDSAALDESCGMLPRTMKLTQGPGLSYEWSSHMDSTSLSTTRVHGPSIALRLLKDDEGGPSGSRPAGATPRGTASKQHVELAVVTASLRVTSRDSAVPRAMTTVGAVMVAPTLLACAALQHAFLATADSARQRRQRLLDACEGGSFVKLQLPTLRADVGADSGDPEDRGGVTGGRPPDEELASILVSYSAALAQLGLSQDGEASATAAKELQALLQARWRATVQARRRAATALYAVESQARQRAAAAIPPAVAEPLVGPLATASRAPSPFTGPVSSTGSQPLVARAASWTSYRDSPDDRVVHVEEEEDVDSDSTDTVVGHEERKATPPKRTPSSLSNKLTASRADGGVDGHESPRSASPGSTSSSCDSFVSADGGMDSGSGVDSEHRRDALARPRSRLRPASPPLRRGPSIRRLASHTSYASHASERMLERFQTAQGGEMRAFIEAGRQGSPVSVANVEDDSPQAEPQAGPSRATRTTYVAPAPDGSAAAPPMIPELAEAPAFTSQLRGLLCYGTVQPSLSLAVSNPGGRATSRSEAPWADDTAAVCEALAVLFNSVGDMDDETLTSGHGWAPSAYGEPQALDTVMDALLPSTGRQPADVTEGDLERDYMSLLAEQQGKAVPVSDTAVTVPSGVKVHVTPMALRTLSQCVDALAKDSELQADVYDVASAMAAAAVRSGANEPLASAAVATAAVGTIKGSHSSSSRAAKGSDVVPSLLHTVDVLRAMGTTLLQSCTPASVPLPMVVGPAAEGPARPDQALRLSIPVVRLALLHAAEAKATPQQPGRPADADAVILMAAELTGVKASVRLGDKSGFVSINSANAAVQLLTDAAGSTPGPGLPCVPPYWRGVMGSRELPQQDQLGGLGDRSVFSSPSPVLAMLRMDSGKAAWSTASQHRDNSTDKVGGAGKQPQVKAPRPLGKSKDTSASTRNLLQSSMRNLNAPWQTGSRRNLLASPAATTQPASAVSAHHSPEIAVTEVDAGLMYFCAVDEGLQLVLSTVTCWQYAAGALSKATTDWTASRSAREATLAAAMAIAASGTPTTSQPRTTATAPRAIVARPVGSAFCSTRQAMIGGLPWHALDSASTATGTSKVTSAGLTAGLQHVATISELTSIHAQPCLAPTPAVLSAWRVGGHSQAALTLEALLLWSASAGWLSDRLELPASEATIPGHTATWSSVCSTLFGGSQASQLAPTQWHLLRPLTSSYPSAQLAMYKGPAEQLATAGAQVDPAAVRQAPVSRIRLNIVRAGVILLAPTLDTPTASGTVAAPGGIVDMTPSLHVEARAVAVSADSEDTSKLAGSWELDGLAHTGAAPTTVAPQQASSSAGFVALRSSNTKVVLGVGDLDVTVAPAVARAAASLARHTTSATAAAATNTRGSTEFATSVPSEVRCGDDWAIGLEVRRCIVRAVQHHRPVTAHGASAEAVRAAAADSAAVFSLPGPTSFGGNEMPATVVTPLARPIGGVLVLSLERAAVSSTLLLGGPAVSFLAAAEEEAQRTMARGAVPAAAAGPGAVASTAAPSALTTPPVYLPRSPSPGQATQPAQATGKSRDGEGSRKYSQASYASTVRQPSKDGREANVSGKAVADATTAADISTGPRPVTTVKGIHLLTTLARVPVQVTCVTASLDGMHVAVLASSEPARARLPGLAMGEACLLQDDTAMQLGQYAVCGESTAALLQRAQAYSGQPIEPAHLEQDVMGLQHASHPTLPTSVSSVHTLHSTLPSFGQDDDGAGGIGAADSYHHMPSVPMRSMLLRGPLPTIPSAEALYEGRSSTAGVPHVSGNTPPPAPGSRAPQHGRTSSPPVLSPAPRTPAAVRSVGRSMMSAASRTTGGSSTTSSYGVAPGEGGSPGLVTLLDGTKLSPLLFSPGRDGRGRGARANDDADADSRLSDARLLPGPLVIPGPSSWRVLRELSCLAVPVLQRQDKGTDDDHDGPVVRIARQSGGLTLTVEGARLQTTSVAGDGAHAAEVTLPSFSRQSVILDIGRPRLEAHLHDLDLEALRALGMAWATAAAVIPATPKQDQSNSSSTAEPSQHTVPAAPSWSRACVNVTGGALYALPLPTVLVKYSLESATATVLRDNGTSDGALSGTLGTATTAYPRRPGPDSSPKPAAATTSASTAALWRVEYGLRIGAHALILSKVLPTAAPATPLQHLIAARTSQPHRQASGRTSSTGGNSGTTGSSRPQLRRAASTASASGHGPAFSKGPSTGRGPSGGRRYSGPQSTARKPGSESSDRRGSNGDQTPADPGLTAGKTVLLDLQAAEGISAVRSVPAMLSDGQAGLLLATFPCVYPPPTVVGEGQQTGSPRQHELEVAPYAHAYGLTRMTIEDVQAVPLPGLWLRALESRHSRASFAALVASQTSTVGKQVEEATAAPSLKDIVVPAAAREVHHWHVNVLVEAADQSLTPGLLVHLLGLQARLQKELASAMSLVKELLQKRVQPSKPSDGQTEPGLRRAGSLPEGLKAGAGHTRGGTLAASLAQEALAAVVAAAAEPTGAAGGEAQGSADNNATSDVFVVSSLDVVQQGVGVTAEAAWRGGTTGAVVRLETGTLHVTVLGHGLAPVNSTDGQVQTGPAFSSNTHAFARLSGLQLTVRGPALEAPRIRRSHRGTSSEGAKDGNTTSASGVEAEESRTGRRRGSSRGSSRGRVQRSTSTRPTPTADGQQRYAPTRRGGSGGQRGLAGSRSTRSGDRPSRASSGHGKSQGSRSSADGGSSSGWAARATRDDLIRAAFNMGLPHRARDRSDSRPATEGRSGTACASGEDRSSAFDGTPVDELEFLDLALPIPLAAAAYANIARGVAKDKSHRSGAAGAGRDRAPSLAGGSFVDDTGSQRSGTGSAVTSRSQTRRAAAARQAQRRSLGGYRIFIRDEDSGRGRAGTDGSGLAGDGAAASPVPRSEGPGGSFAEESPQGQASQPKAAYVHVARAPLLARLSSNIRLANLPGSSAAGPVAPALESAGPSGPASGQGRGVLSSMGHAFMGEIYDTGLLFTPMAASVLMMFAQQYRTALSEYAAAAKAAWMGWDGPGTKAVDKRRSGQASADDASAAPAQDSPASGLGLGGEQLLSLAEPLIVPDVAAAGGQLIRRVASTTSITVDLRVVRTSVMMPYYCHRRRHGASDEGIVMQDGAGADTDSVPPSGQPQGMGMAPGYGSADAYGAPTMPGAYAGVNPYRFGYGADPYAMAGVQPGPGIPAPDLTRQSQSDGHSDSRGSRSHSRSEGGVTLRHVYDPVVPGRMPVLSALVLSLASVGARVQASNLVSAILQAHQQSQQHGANSAQPQVSVGSSAGHTPHVSSLSGLDQQLVMDTVLKRMSGTVSVEVTGVAAAFVPVVQPAALLRRTFTVDMASLQRCNTVQLPRLGAEVSVDNVSGDVAVDGSPGPDISDTPQHQRSLDSAGTYTSGPKPLPANTTPFAITANVVAAAPIVRADTSLVLHAAGLAATVTTGLLLEASVDRATVAAGVHFHVEQDRGLSTGDSTTGPSLQASSKHGYALHRHRTFRVMGRRPRSDSGTGSDTSTGLSRGSLQSREFEGRRAGYGRADHAWHDDRLDEAEDEHDEDEEEEEVVDDDYVADSPPRRHVTGGMRGRAASNRHVDTDHDNDRDSLDYGHGGYGGHEEDDQYEEDGEDRFERAESVDRPSRGLGGATGLAFGPGFGLGQGPQDGLPSSGRASRPVSLPLILINVTASLQPGQLLLIDTERSDTAVPATPVPDLQEQVESTGPIFNRQNVLFKLPMPQVTAQASYCTDPQLADTIRARLKDGRAAAFTVPPVEGAGVSPDQAVNSGVVDVYLAPVTLSPRVLVFAQGILREGAGVAAAAHAELTLRAAELAAERAANGDAGANNSEESPLYDEYEQQDEDEQDDEGREDGHRERGDGQQGPTRHGSGRTSREQLPGVAVPRDALPTSPEAGKAWMHLSPEARAELLAAAAEDLKRKRPVFVLIFVVRPTSVTALAEPLVKNCALTLLLPERIIVAVSAGMARVALPGASPLGSDGAMLRSPLGILGATGGLGSAAGRRNWSGGAGETSPRSPASFGAASAPAAGVGRARGPVLSGFRPGAAVSDPSAGQRYRQASDGSQTSRSLPSGEGEVDIELQALTVVAPALELVLHTTAARTGSTVGGPVLPPSRPDRRAGAIPHKATLGDAGRDSDPFGHSVQEDMASGPSQSFPASSQFLCLRLPSVQLQGSRAVGLLESDSPFINVYTEASTASLHLDAARMREAFTFLRAWKAMHEEAQALVQAASGLRIPGTDADAGAAARDQTGGPTSPTSPQRQATAAADDTSGIPRGSDVGRWLVVQTTLGAAVVTLDLSAINDTLVSLRLTKLSTLFTDLQPSRPGLQPRDLNVNHLLHASSIHLATSGQLEGGLILNDIRAHTVGNYVELKKMGWPQLLRWQPCLHWLGAHVSSVRLDLRNAYAGSSRSRLVHARLTNLGAKFGEEIDSALLDRAMGSGTPVTSMPRDSASPDKGDGAEDGNGGAEAAAPKLGSLVRTRGRVRIDAIDADITAEGVPFLLEFGGDVIVFGLEEWADARAAVVAALGRHKVLEIKREVDTGKAGARGRTAAPPLPSCKWPGPGSGPMTMVPQQGLPYGYGPAPGAPLQAYGQYGMAGGPGQYYGATHWQSGMASPASPGSDVNRRPAQPRAEQLVDTAALHDMAWGRMDISVGKASLRMRLSSSGGAGGPAAGPLVSSAGSVISAQAGPTGAATGSHLDREWVVVGLTELTVTLEQAPETDETLGVERIAQAREILASQDHGRAAVHAAGRPSSPGAASGDSAGEGRDDDAGGSADALDASGGVRLVDTVAVHRLLRLSLASAHLNRMGPATEPGKGKQAARAGKRTSDAGDTDPSSGQPSGALLARILSLPSCTLELETAQYVTEGLVQRHTPAPQQQRAGQPGMGMPQGPYGWASPGMQAPYGYAGGHGQQYGPRAGQVGLEATMYGFHPDRGSAARGQIIVEEPLGPVVALSLEPDVWYVLGSEFGGSIGTAVNIKDWEAVTGSGAGKPGILTVILSRASAAMSSTSAAIVDARAQIDALDSKATGPEAGQGKSGKGAGRASSTVGRGQVVTGKGQSRAAYPDITSPVRSNMSTVGPNRSPGQAGGPVRPLVFKPNHERAEALGRQGPLILDPQLAALGDMAVSNLSWLLKRLGVAGTAAVPSHLHSALAQPLAQALFMANHTSRSLRATLHGSKTAFYPPPDSVVTTVDPVTGAREYVFAVSGAHAAAAAAAARLGLAATLVHALGESSTGLGDDAELEQMHEGFTPDDGMPEPGLQSPYNARRRRDRGRRDRSRSRSPAPAMQAPARAGGDTRHRAVAPAAAPATPPPSAPVAAGSARGNQAAAARAGPGPAPHQQPPPQPVRRPSDTSGSDYGAGFDGGFYSPRPGDDDVAI